MRQLRQLQLRFAVTEWDFPGKRRPASFIFVGSTGVGKTELVKQLAAEMFESAEA